MPKRIAAARRAGERIKEFVDAKFNCTAGVYARIFEEEMEKNNNYACVISWQGDLGPTWMNADNLMRCLTTPTCYEGVELSVEDIMFGFVDGELTEAEVEHAASLEAEAVTLTGG